MTLVLTEISQFGIAMAADSAVSYTVELPDGKTISRVLTGVRKLQTIRKLNAGISIWGEGMINEIPTDLWLEDFVITRENEYDSLSMFASLLQDELRRHIPEIDASELDEGTIGFHLAGFVNYEGRLTPTFYHIHNGISRDKEQQEEDKEINPRKVNANHYIPPIRAREKLDNGDEFLIRGGDFKPYTMVFRLLSELFKNLATYENFIIPDSSSVEDRAEWLKFEIKTMADLYSFSNEPISVIGGDIATLTISEDGTIDYKRK